MSSSDVVKLPSGLSGVISALKGREMRLLGDKQAMRSGLFLDKIFTACWLETLDSGPYSFEGKPDWSRVLTGDRTYLLLQIRVRTFGAAFPFAVQCPNPSCRQKFTHDLDLNELSVKELSEEDRAAFASGNVLSGSLPDGNTFRFKLRTGADEVKAMRAGGAVDPLGIIKSRVQQIDGLDDRGKNAFFEDADWSTIFGILAEMDQHDCGVETKVSLNCLDCSEAIDIEVPFDGLLTPPKRSIQTTK